MDHTEKQSFEISCCQVGDEMCQLEEQNVNTIYKLKWNTLILKHLLDPNFQFSIAPAAVFVQWLKSKSTLILMYAQVTMVHTVMTEKGMSDVRNDTMRNLKEGTLIFFVYCLNNHQPNKLTIKRKYER